jgi:hypothetical protein
MMNILHPTGAAKSFVWLVPAAAPLFDEVHVHPRAAKEVLNHEAVLGLYEYDRNELYY